MDNEVTLNRTKMNLQGVFAQLHSGEDSIIEFGRDNCKRINSASVLTQGA